MGNIFKKKETKTAVMASAPEVPESQAEATYNPEITAPVEPVEPVAPVPQIQQVPVIMSEADKWNMVIENNMLLKHIVSKIEED